MNASLLRAEKVSKVYPAVRALSSVSFDVSEGAFFSIIGPSGSGKSSLLKIMCGVEAATEGDIIYKGQRIFPGDPEFREIIMVWQSLALFPHMNVEDNIAFGLSVRNVSRREGLKVVEEMLAMVDLRGYGKRRIYELSGGEQQRVALARSLAVQPRMLLLDEPLGSLDMYLRGEILVELKKLHRETGITFVMVTHDQSEALAVSTQVGVMNRGRLEQVGTPQEIVKSPNTPFVARFVGDRNVLDGVVRAVDRRWCTVRTELGVFEAMRREKWQVEIGEKVAYIIDSANIKEGESCGNRLSGAYVGALKRGSSQLVRLGVGENRTFSYEVVASGYELDRVLGNRITVSWCSEDAYLLPATPAVGC